jgi:hypothetical protein
MAGAKAYRQLPAASRQRGLPSIGFEITPSEDLEVTPVSAGETLLRCTETRAGRPIGELDVTVFSAALVIDRDGILEAKASDNTGGAHAVPVVLPGASGYFAETRGDEQLPYRYVFAIAPHDLAVDGGVLVTVRSALPDWPAADRVLQSLRIITRHGTAPANDGAADAPILPFIPPLRRDE